MQTTSLLDWLLLLVPFTVLVYWFGRRWRVW